jgi:GrpB-like predicted nucleotidyltransferase (UPF0157 family)
VAKSLADMTNEERWRLFPITLKEHDPQWKMRYLDEKKLLYDHIGTENIERISHIGSTSVAGLIAKPTIDILIEIMKNTDLDKLIADIKAAGYLFSRQNNNPPPHMMFMKGYTPEGFRGQVFHVHVRYSGDWILSSFPEHIVHYKATDNSFGSYNKACFYDFLRYHIHIWIKLQYSIVEYDQYHTDHKNTGKNVCPVPDKGFGELLYPAEGIYYLLHSFRTVRQV